MTTTASTCIDALLGSPKFGKGIGFRRMQLLLRPLMDSEWGRRFTTIRITGSNGKGSVAAIVHSILCRLGINCGRYTSPHLFRFNERIVIGNREITDAEIGDAYDWVIQRLTDIHADLHDDAFGSFELITSMCIRSFCSSGVAVGVMEAGIGGRYDPTRIFSGSLIALTSIDLEHTDLLGKTKELIAYDKVDLCPDGGTIVSVGRDLLLWERLEAYCRIRSLRLIDANEMWKTQCIPPGSSSELGRMDVHIVGDKRSLDCKVPLVGTFQLDNIAIAVSTVELWVREWRPDVTDEEFADAVVSGLQEVRWPGRFEQICNSPPVIIDVGHSPDACSRVVESVRTFLEGKKILLVTGVSANKAVEDILRILVPVADGILCTRAYHRGERVDRIATIVRRLAPEKQVWEASTIEEATILAKGIGEDQRMTVLVAGGLFLAIEFRTAWERSDPRTLRFY